MFQLCTVYTVNIESLSGTPSRIYLRLRFDTLLWSVYPKHSPHYISTPILCLNLRSVYFLPLSRFAFSKYEMSFRHRRPVRMPTLSFICRWYTQLQRSCASTAADSRRAVSEASNATTPFTEPHNQNLTDLLRVVESSSQTGLTRPTKNHCTSHSP